MLLKAVILTGKRTGLYLKCVLILTGILPQVVSRAENITCSSGCSPGPDNTTEPCNITSGECLYGCHDGFYGSNCTQSCYDKDKHCMRCIAKNDSSGIVCNECKRNFYRYSGKCITCNYWCKQAPSSPSPNCRESDGYCNHGCRPGRYGTKCGLRCSSNCKDTCQRATGTCDGEECAYVSYCGPTCELPCQDGCKSQYCNISCDCVDDCNLNYWGAKCKKLCSAKCIPTTDSNSRTCDISDGTCLYGCKDNQYWGDECKYLCSEGCVNGTCQQKTGNCIDKCKSKTVYGERCDTKCSKNCLDGTCEIADGYCDKGCVKGSFGEKCTEKCNINCINDFCERVYGSCNNGCMTGFYGEQCEIACSEKCLGLKCDRVSGYCTDGCISGYQGFQCQCGSNKEQTDNTAMIVGVTLGVFSAVVVVYAIYVTVLLKRKTTDKGTGHIKKLTTQTTYANLGFQSDSTANQASTSSIDNADISREDEDNSDKQYTSLDHSNKDNNTTYDVIQRV